LSNLNVIFTSAEQVSLCHCAASVVQPSTFHIFNFFSRTA